MSRDCLGDGNRNSAATRRALLLGGTCAAALGALSPALAQVPQPQPRPQAAPQRSLQAWRVLRWARRRRRGAARARARATGPPRLHETNHH